MKNTILVIALQLVLLSYASAQNVGVGNTTPQTTLDVEGDFALRPVKINMNTGQNDDLDVTTDKSAFYILVNPSADYSLTGIASNVPGRVITFYNTVPYKLTLLHLNAGSASSNQLILPDQKPMVIPPSGSFTARYDGSNWIVTSSAINSLNSLSGWTTSGNQGTDTASHFIGTTDNMGLSVKTNNIERMHIDNEGYTKIYKDSLELLTTPDFTKGTSPLGALPFVGAHRLLENGNLVSGIFKDPGASWSSLSGYLNLGVGDVSLNMASNFGLQSIAGNFVNYRLSTFGMTQTQIGLNVNGGANSNVSFGMDSTHLSIYANTQDTNSSFNINYDGFNLSNNNNTASTNFNCGYTLNNRYVNVSNVNLNRNTGIQQADSAWNLYINDNSGPNQFSNVEARVDRINSNITKGDTNSYMNRNYDQWNITNTTNTGAGKGVALDANLERVRHYFWNNNSPGRYTSLQMDDTAYIMTTNDNKYKLGVNVNNPHSNLHTNGSVANEAMIAISDQDLTLDATHYFVLASAHNLPVTVTLPPAASCNGRQYIIKRSDNILSNSLTIDADGAETIDGALTHTLAAQYQTVKVICFSGAWYIIP